MEQLQIDKGNAAIGIATALLDCVIAGPDGGDFRISRVVDDPEHEAYVEVRAYTEDGQRAVTITVNEESGEIVERRFHPIEP